MKRFPSSAAFLVAIFLAANLGLTSATSAQDKPAVAGNPDEIAIRKSIDLYVDAFNKGDAKSLAALWNEDGELVTPAGAKLKGHQELEHDFAKYFAEKQSAKLELPETEITLLSPNVAVETGVARVLVPDQEPSETEYEAIYVKTAAGWKIDSISEQQAPAPTPSHHEQLQSLEWMVGTWVNINPSSEAVDDTDGVAGNDTDGEARVETTCRWTTNQNFLVRSFKVYVQDRIDFEGTQVIGWDPHLLAIRSWIFDTDGGFGVGRWSTQGDDRWNVRTLNVLPDGRRGSATQVYEKLDENTAQFSSIGRQVDGVLLPSIEPITVSRVTE